VRHDLAKLLRQASACGWQLSRTRGGHWLLRHPSGAVVVTSGSPSDWRTLRNTRAQMRRAERGTAA
jgi:predicted RNA binding protein YcfA (HicA-like mRNA interferase family)